MWKCDTVVKLGEMPIPVGEKPLRGSREAIVSLIVRHTQTLGFQTPASKLHEVLHRLSELTALTAKVGSWYGKCPNCPTHRH
jgi:hypothetical protein